MIERKILFGLACMLWVTPITLTVAAQSTFDHEHILLTEVLDKYVTAGLVNYSALKTDPADLNEYLQDLAEIDSEAYEKWSRQEKLALWINAYNAFTIRVILDHYPIEYSWLADPLGQYPNNSIRQISGVWDDSTWRIMGKDYSLDHMEHVIMRRELVDPRIHFVLVCASKGCPYLENRAFGASDLEARLDRAGINYIYKSRRVKINKERKLVMLPQIFKWFAEDFESGTQHKGLFTDHPSELAGILSWVYQYANDEDRRFLLQDSYQISYTYYDWALNE
jgi:hypothetical protein